MPVSACQKTCFFDRLAEVKGAAKTSKPHSSAYIGTVEGGLRSKSKCLAQQGLFTNSEVFAFLLPFRRRKAKQPTIQTYILTVGGFFDTLQPPMARPWGGSIFPSPAPLPDKFRFSGQMPSHQSTGHCEPVTDVTGVAIPFDNRILSYF